MSKSVSSILRVNMSIETFSSSSCVDQIGGKQKAAWAGWPGPMPRPAPPAPCCSALCWCSDTPGEPGSLCPRDSGLFCHKCGILQPPSPAFRLPFPQGPCLGLLIPSPLVWWTLIHLFKNPTQMASFLRRILRSLSQPRLLLHVTGLCMLLSLLHYVVIGCWHFFSLWP